MGALEIHANEVRNCKGCYARIVWLENAYKRRCALNVPDGEKGKRWLSVDDKDRHGCPRKDRLTLLKSKIGRA
jgi:hypothetical protein